MDLMWRIDNFLMVFEKIKFYNQLLFMVKNIYIFYIYGSLFSIIFFY